jgi:hypothetical protein
LTSKADIEAYQTLCGINASISGMILGMKCWFGCWLTLAGKDPVVTVSCLLLPTFILMMIAQMMTLNQLEHLENADQGPFIFLPLSGSLEVMAKFL